MASGLSIGYRTRKAATSIVARNLNLALEQGKFICLLGPNGAGKSTLIRTLGGIQPILEGEVTLAGKVIETMEPRARAKTISLVLTQTMPQGLFNAYSMVALGRHPHTNWNGHLTDEDRKKINWALSAVKGEQLASRQISELSDGERQKIVVARALAQEAPVMLLDEPTAYLDIVRRVELMKTLRQLAHSQGMAILQSTHDLELALRSADELWLFSEDGTIIKGTPESLALSGSMAKVFGSSDLEWDMAHGSFHIHEEPSSYVHLEGTGPELIWTQRMLVRLGYGVATAGQKVAFSIAIEKKDSSTTWTVNKAEERMVLESLEMLTCWIEGFHN
jgi:iron complex transport system ATP-binding protein